jgi:hypothetical protein
MKRTTASWKQKIDPAFPKFIRSYLSVLDSFGLPRSEGYIHMKDTEGFLQAELSHVLCKSNELTIGMSCSVYPFSEKLLLLLPVPHIKPYP